MRQGSIRKAEAKSTPAGTARKEKARLVKAVSKRKGSKPRKPEKRLAETSAEYGAISGILRVMSESPGDVGPVLAAVAEQAAHLCEAPFAGVLLADGDVLRSGARYSLDGTKRDPAPLPLKRSSIAGRAVLDRVTVHHGDVVPLLNSEYPDAVNARRLRLRAVLSVPLIRQGKAYGAIFLFRRQPRAFSPGQVALVETFAQQAAIAIDNVRLFNETKQALEQQRASAEILATISSSIADTKPVFDKILESCARLFAGRIISINLVGQDGLVHMMAHHGPGREALKKQHPRFSPGDGRYGSAMCISSQQVSQYPDMQDANVPVGTRESSLVAGVRAAVFAPMIWEGRGIGAITVGREYPGPFSDKEISLLKIFADQAVIAVQNARLFREIEDKSHQLEIASQHKSEFLANMSHELRTPLNAIIGFSEVLSERMFGEINEKQAEYLADIQESGRHLLSLINDILDLSKIEAGRMELESNDFDLPSAIEHTLTLVRERAQRRGIGLARTVDEQLGMIHADERKLKQVLLNLLSNALKFTPEGGRVDVRAALRDGVAEVSVTDTGIGISPEDQEAVFEEFRQVGTASKKVEGTGLGLAISRKFVELHGGRIWVTSQVGTGSTFAFTLPLR